MFKKNQIKICFVLLGLSALANSGFAMDPVQAEAQYRDCETCAELFDKSLLKCCAKCKRVYYCSVKCQKEDWPQHKLKCETAEILKKPTQKEGCDRVIAVLKAPGVSQALLAALNTTTFEHRKNHMYFVHPIMGVRGVHLDFMARTGCSGNVEQDNKYMNIATAEIKKLKEDEISIMVLIDGATTYANISLETLKNL